MSDVSDFDVMEYWSDRISGADEAHEMLGDPECPPELQCISHLAAEVRRLRENEVCADTECRDLHIRELQVRLDDSEHGFKLALGDSGEYRRQVEELQARVKELESDARLGCMVREMTEGALLRHCVYTTGRSDFAYLEPRPNWGALSSCERHGDTPEDAIQAVRSKP